MQIEPTGIPDCYLITPKLHGDSRGLFVELYQQQRFADAGLPSQFVQDNFSRSARGILRGLHYQIQQPQGKFVQVVSGQVYDVAVDLRRSSPAFGTFVGVTLDSDTRQQFYVPPGCAHGYYVMSESADFLYKCTDFYFPEHERTLSWDDADLKIPWPLVGTPLLSVKDRAGMSLSQCETYE